MTEFVETRATDPDAVALLTEYLDFREATFPSPGVYRRSPADPAQFARPRGAFVVARDNGIAIGCGGVRLLDAERAEVKHLWLRPAVQGRGVGRLLLAHLEGIARDLGANTVVLDTNASLAAAAALYRSAGYAPVPAYNDNPNANVWLGKPLLR